MPRVRLPYVGWVALVAILPAGWTATARGAAKLSAAQSIEILREANAFYDQGRQAMTRDPAEAKQAFASAARKYQTLVDCGVDRGKLFFNVANAYLQGGQIGRAIANYQRARVRLPGDRSIVMNLQYARSLVRHGGESQAPTSIWQSISLWNATISRSARWAIVATGWALVWMALIGRLYAAKFPLRSMTAVGLILSLLAGASIGYAWLQTPRGERGIVVTQTVLRQGNSQAFDAEYETPLREGDAVRVLDRRGDWLHVRTGNGHIGWMPAASAELIRVPSHLCRRPATNTTVSLAAGTLPAIAFVCRPTP